MKRIILAVALVFGLALPTFAVVSTTDAVVGTEQEADAHYEVWVHCTGWKTDRPWWAAQGTTFSLNKDVGPNHAVGYCIMTGTIQCFDYDTFSYYTRSTGWFQRNSKGTSSRTKECYSGDYWTSSWYSINGGP